MEFVVPKGDVLLFSECSLLPPAGRAYMLLPGNRIHSRKHERKIKRYVCNKRSEADTNESWEGENIIKCTPHLPRASAHLLHSRGR